MKSISFLLIALFAVAVIGCCEREPQPTKVETRTQPISPSVQTSPDGKTVPLSDQELRK